MRPRNPLIAVDGERIATIARRSLLWLPAALPSLARGAIVGNSADDPIVAAAARIRPLFTPKKPVRPGDWLAEHREPGQTYAEFRAAIHRRTIDSYDTLRIVLIGALTKGQVEVFETVTDFLGPFFDLRIVLDTPVPIGEIPVIAQRESGGSRQLLTPYLLNRVLLKRRRTRDAAVLGLTAYDLWPGSGWNFVFGQASLTERVGVWSMARNGETEGRAAMRRVCALRTAMTATHETGHMLGIRHCIAYECGMNGSNHAEERDRQPFEFCPECQPKLWWTLGLDPLERSRALERLARRHGFNNVAAAFSRQSTALARTTAAKIAM
jgi:archaemetzincin